VDDPERALECAIRDRSRRAQDPDPKRRWTFDTVFCRRGRILAVLRITPTGIKVTRFDPAELPPVETVEETDLASSPVIDGMYALGSDGTYARSFPLPGPDPGTDLGATIDAILESIRNHHPDYPETEDVFLAPHGRILAVIRMTVSGPVVTRFDQPGPSTVMAAGIDRE
jgi:hypothetical protein